MQRRKRRRPKRNSHIVDQHLYKLSLLREFIAKFGWDKLKRETVVASDVYLYRWVTARRVDYRSDKIADWLVPECEAIPGWSWTVFGDAYRRNLDNLRTFVRKHGWDALATKPVVDGARLDKWVAHRRDEYRNRTLDAWLIRALEALPGWTWDPRRAGYERNLHELRVYIAKHGWSSLRANTVTDSEIHLGHWVCHVRALRRRGELEAWVEAELERVPGWTWDPRRSSQQANIDRLAKFVSKHGWNDVTDALVVDEVKIGDWISNCRMRYRGGSLPEETISGLEAIPGWSWIGRTSWHQPKNEAGQFAPLSPRQRRRRVASHTE